MALEVLRIPDAQPVITSSVLSFSSERFPCNWIERDVEILDMAAGVFTGAYVHDHRVGAGRYNRFAAHAGSVFQCVDHIGLFYPAIATTGML